MRKVYLDSAATTYVSSEVLNEMLPCFNTEFGNANSIHGFGRDAQAIVDTARDRIKDAVNAELPTEIYFTSGGTEANNWAIKGIARAYKNKGNHIITTKIEHPSVISSCKQLEDEGFKVTYLPVDKNGLVDFIELIHAITPQTILISVMAVNNEVGTIQNIKAIGMTASENNIFYHVDGVQALGALKLDVQDMRIDALSISSHKIYGPKGVGALYLNKKVRIKPLIVGGAQERTLRGGTTNVPGIAGFGKAVQIAVANIYPNLQKLKSIRQYFLNRVSKEIPYIKINGHANQKVQGIANVSFEYIEGESILMMLDLKGIAVSTGSACSSKTLKSSYVLEAMGVPSEIAQGSIRFSFPVTTNIDDIDYVIENLKETVAKLREISALDIPKKKKAKGKKKNV